MIHCLCVLHVRFSAISVSLIGSEHFYPIDQENISFLFRKSNKLKSIPHDLQIRRRALSRLDHVRTTRRASGQKGESHGTSVVIERTSTFPLSTSLASL